MLSQPLDVPSMLTAVAERHQEWLGLQAILGKPQEAFVVDALPGPPVPSRELAALLRMVEDRGAEGLRACSHATGLSLLEGARLAAVGFGEGWLRHRPVAAARVSHALTSLLALAGPALPGPAAQVAPHKEAFAPAFIVTATRDHLSTTPLPAADARDARQRATALRAAAEVHAQREATVRRGFSPAFTAPVPVTAPDSTAPVPAWTKTANPTTVPATWGQGYLSLAPPGSAGSGRDPQADTASLMRELTSLGRSEEAAEADSRSTYARPPSPTSAPAPAPSAERRRRSFFGR